MRHMSQDVDNFISAEATSRAQKPNKDWLK
jgi:hypothetical protein